MSEPNTIFLEKIIQDFKQNTEKSTDKTREKITKTKEILSTKQIKRNISNENFIKFSWSWTL
jgi:hypothetical protein